MTKGLYYTITHHLFSKKSLVIILVVSLISTVLGTVYAFMETEGTPLLSQGLLSMLYSFFITASLYYGCALIITRLNTKLPWKTQFKKRLWTEVILVLVYVNSIQSVVIYFFYGKGIIECQGSLAELYFRNLLIGNAITIIVVTLIEGGYFFKNWKASLLAEERLKKENVQSQFTQLRAQLDPHFLFNSLNVLSGIIKDDPEKAERFVEDFANIYRYVLDVKDEMLVLLRDELLFVERYLSLQKVRFEKGLEININVAETCRNHFLPPLSLQELVSNALKHNIVDVNRPLRIEIFCNNNFVEVKNNLQTRQNEESTKLGLENLKGRYQFIFNKPPVIEETKYYFKVSLPLVPSGKL